MAKRTPERGDNRDDLELKKFTYDPVENKSYVNIDDEGIVDAISNISGSGNTTSEIQNEALVSGVEKEIDMGSDIVEFLFRSRNKNDIKLAFSLGNTSTEYITIKRRAVYVDSKSYTNLKIYVLSEAADVLEIVIKRKGA